MLLVTGANGQLGSELKKIFPEALFVDIADLDITKEADVIEFVEKHNIDTIINCAAYTNVDKAEDEPDLCRDINVYGPATLAKTGAKLIHISTDYVFDGTNFKPYTTQDFPTPNSVYGKTKAAGEIAALEGTNTVIVIRTSWLYSSFGNNFVKTMIRLGKEKESINVVCDQIGTPTYAADLAKAIVQILPQLTDGHKGVYHFSNYGACSWYDFAIEIMEMAGLKCKVVPIPSTGYPTKAVRPYYSVLDKSKIVNEYKIDIPYWKDSLRKCVDLL